MNFLPLFKGTDGLGLLIFILLIIGAGHTIFKHFNLIYQNYKKDEVLQKIQNKMSVGAFEELTK
jgi:hypothetical protein